MYRKDPECRGSLERIFPKRINDRIVFPGGGRRYWLRVPRVAQHTARSPQRGERGTLHSFAWWRSKGWGWQRSFPCFMVSSVLRGIWLRHKSKKRNEARASTSMNSRAATHCTVTIGNSALVVHQCGKQGAKKMCKKLKKKKKSRHGARCHKHARDFWFAGVKLNFEACFPCDFIFELKKFGFYLIVTGFKAYPEKWNS